ncbi:DUF262 domain-containing protein [Actinocorallia lasiicapitis]
MGDAPVDGRGQTVKVLFAEKKFGLDDYQREYSWARDDVRRLLEDLWRRFSTSWNELHDRQAAVEYPSYFLGSYVYYNQGSVTYLVDGQQRITTLHLLLVQLRRFLLEQGLSEDAETVSALIASRRFGKRTFTVDIPERNDVLEAFIKGDDSFRPREGASLSVRNLWERGRDLVEDFPPGLLGEALPYFQDWLLERVCLVGIQAADREQGWEIFETMNDRGRRLSPVDLLKGYLLENALPDQRAKLNVKWRQMLTRLAEFEGSTGSDFVKALLLAKYADLGEGSPDPAAIDRSFHEWIRRHAATLGLRKPSDFVTFVGETLPRFADHYCTLLRASAYHDTSLPAVFYNAVNGLNRQYQLILAAVDVRDDLSTFKRKARLVSDFLDLVLVRTFVRGNAVHPSDLDDLIRQVTLLLRDCRTAEDVARVLGAQLTAEPLNEIATLSLSSGNYRQVRYFLARLTAFVEDGSGKHGRIADYLNPERPWQIEHIWSCHYDVALAPNRKAFDIQRNRIGALLLLDRSDNASFRDAPYQQKVEHYFRLNVLAASLHQNTYQNFPGFRKFVERHELKGVFRAFTVFDKAAIASRLALYQRLAQLIWDPDRLGFPLPTVPRSGPEHRTKAHYGVTVANLVQAGLLTAGATLVGQYLRVEHFATVLDDGRLRLANGSVYTSLSGAGAAVRGGRACAGWDFWHLRNGADRIQLKELRSELLRRTR